MTCREDMDTAIARLAEVETETVGRIVPLQAACPVDQSMDAVSVIAEASDLLPGPDPEAGFKVLCSRRGHHEWRSRDVETAVGKRIESRLGALAEYKNPEQIVAVEIFQDVAYLGVAWADEILHKEITRMRKWAPGQRPLNRAELKLREIIERYDLALSEDARALDIGASPGGWSKVLSEHVAEVWAVDPGELDERVLSIPNVTHVRARAETLVDRDDTGVFDIVTNDMNMDPERSAQVLCDVAPLLKPGGTMVMTVKFMTRMRRRHSKEAQDILSRCYEGFEVGRVKHNAKEATIVGRRKATLDA